ncbi:MAG: META domain-containing protein [Actinobacteria bacterium]|nr:META domain-containing protein [Actinomycetota bacterium]
MSRPTSSRAAAIRSLGLLLGAFALAGLIAACGDDSGTTAKKPAVTTAPGKGAGTAPGGLAGTSWSLVQAVEATSQPTLDFSTDGKVSGSTGCNRFSGTYAQKGAGIRITLGPLTRAACTSDAATRQEQQIISGLGAARRADQAGATLVLRDGGGKQLLSYAAVSGQLAGTSWSVRGVNTGNAVETSALTEKLTLQFGSGGAISGDGGCNTFRGTYTQSGSNVKISGLSSTMMGCEQDVSNMEAKYLAALQASTKVTRSGNSLELRDDKGALQVNAVLAG